MGVHGFALVKARCFASLATSAKNQGCARAARFGGGPSELVDRDGQDGFTTG
jgi:hypothetical protein